MEVDARVVGESVVWPDIWLERYAGGALVAYWIVVV